MTPLLSLTAAVFPARAGMNRCHLGDADRRQCVPRTRGDEPDEGAYDAAALKCSPHARG